MQRIVDAVLVFCGVLLFTGLSPAQYAVNRQDRGVIFLESGPITADERFDRELRPDGTPTRLAADIDSDLQKMGLSRGEPAYYIVRLRGPRVARAKEQMSALGAAVMSYNQYYSFIVKMGDVILDQVADLEDVEWIGVYKPEHRISQPLKALIADIQNGSPARGQNATSDGLKQGEMPGPFRGAMPTETEARTGEEALPEKAPASDETIELSIALFSNEGVDTAAHFIWENGGTVRAEVRHERIHEVRAVVPMHLIEQLSAIPEVRMSYEYKPLVLYNDEATGIMGVPNVWNTHALTGSGQIIGHADSGLDTGTIGSGMNDDFEGRIAAAYALGRTGDWSDPDGHGTHTAGSILGNGSNSSNTYRGVAYEAELVHQSVGDANGGLGGIPADIGDLFQQAYDDGARVHSDSWGGGDDGSYGTLSNQLDTWAWNSGSPPDMLIVFAAGNAGPAANTVGYPGTAKNCLTVGASENDRPGCGTDADDINEVANLSARGATDDGRVKPDVVAPGTWIASVKTHGCVTPFSDDMEGGINGWMEEPGDNPWQQTTDQSRSPNTSWYYYQESSVLSFDDYLVSPSFDVPSSGKFYLSFWCQGSFPSGRRVYLKIRRVGESWLTLGWLESAQVESEWKRFSAEIPSYYHGDTVQCGFNPYRSLGGAGAFSFYLDDVAVTTFLSKDDMWAKGLATYGDTVDQNYTLMQGTSMSTPLVAGAAALVRQYCQTEHSHNPSAALVKAILINGATDMTPGTPRPDSDEGWGRINLENSLYPASPRRFFSDDPSSSLNEGQTATIYAQVSNSSEELRATLVWCDHEGSTLQNDLNMTVIAPDSTTYYPATAVAVFAKHTIDGASDGAQSVYATDVDGDGDVDVVGAAYIGDDIAWWENDGNENFTKYIIDGNFDGAHSVYATDVDDDGHVDVLGAAYSADDIAWWKNDGDENFTKYIIDGDFNGAYSVYATDVDGDGDIDVLGAAYLSDVVAWWENDGSESFTTHTIDTTLEWPCSIYATDVDADGDTDVLGAGYYADDIVWWDNDGSANFTKHTITGSFDNASSVYATDVDGDGDIDVLGAAYNADDIAWWENDGNQNFSKHTIDGAFNGAQSVYATDVDGDGDVDILGAARAAYDIAWWENDGNENFTKHTIDGAFNGAECVYAADVDGDGDVDVLGAAYSADEIAWWENEGGIDSVNNVEGIDVASPQTGLWEIQIHAQTIPYGPQPYALFVSGAFEGEPTLAQLVGFRARGLDFATLLEWETDAEVDTAGFNVLRAESPDGPWVKLNEGLIPSEGSSWEGASYTFSDDSREAGTPYWYCVEEVDVAGSTQRYPVELVWDDGLTDADGDGMPDVWEQRLGIGAGSVADAKADADADGVRNLDEYLAGTSPVDTRDCPRLGIERDGERDLFVLAWPTRPGRTYTLVTAGSLAELLGASPIVLSVMPATSDALVQFEDAAAAKERMRFYRLIISPPR